MTSILWIICTIVLFMVNFVISPPPAYIASTRPTIRLSDQEFEHIIKDEQEEIKKNHQPPPDEKTLVRIHILKINYCKKINMDIIIYII